MVDDNGSWADSEYAYPHRVHVWVLPLLPIVWGLIASLIIVGYRILRKGIAKRYYASQQEDELKESLPGIGAANWFGASIERIRTENGIDAALYLLHTQHMCIFCLLQFLALGGPLCMVYWLKGDQEAGVTMYAWSYANLGPNNVFRWCPVAASYLMILTTVLLLVYKQRVMQMYRLKTDKESSNMHTVWVTGLPSDFTEAALLRWLDANHSNEYSVARLVWDVNLLGHNIRKHRKAIMRINAHYDKMRESGKAEDKQLAQIKLRRDRISKLQGAEPALREKKLNCAGSAFVSFQSPAKARQFLAAANAGSVSEARDSGLGSAFSRVGATMAPMPNEIYWENFGLGFKQKAINHLRSYAYTAAVFLLFVAIALSCVWCIGYLYMDVIYQVKPIDAVQDVLHPMQEAVTPYIWYGVISMFLLGAFLFLEEEMATIVKFISMFEMPLTKSQKQHAYMGKCFFFYVIYHLLLSTVLLGVLAATVKIDHEHHGGGAVELWVESVGMFHQNRCFVTACVIDLFHVMEGLKFFTRPAHTLTPEEQGKFVAAEEEDEDDRRVTLEADEFFNDNFNYSRNYGETIGVFSSICYYQVMHPTILLCGAAYYMLKYCIDKYQITNQYTRPHIAYGQRARSTTTYLLCALAVGQVGNSVYFLFLADGMLDVGIGMCGSLLCSVLLAGFYIWQPDCLQGVLADHLEETGGQEGGRRSIALSQQLVYRPPHPERMVVGLEVDDGGMEGIPGAISFTNPTCMDEGTSAAPPSQLWPGLQPVTEEGASNSCLTAPHHVL